MRAITAFLTSVFFASVASGSSVLPARIHGLPPTIRTVETDVATAWSNGRRVVRNAFGEAFLVLSDKYSPYHEDDNGFWFYSAAWASYPTFDYLQDSRYPSIAVDAFGRPHMVFEHYIHVGSGLGDPPGDYVIHATRGPGEARWEREAIQCEMWMSLYAPNAFFHPSIVMPNDPPDRPCIAYIWNHHDDPFNPNDYDYSRVWVYWRNEYHKVDEWTHVTDCFRHPSIGVDAIGWPNIAYDVFDLDVVSKYRRPWNPIWVAYQPIDQGRMPCLDAHGDLVNVLFEYDDFVENAMKLRRWNIQDRQPKGNLATLYDTPSYATVDGRWAAWVTPGSGFTVLHSVLAP